MLRRPIKTSSKKNAKARKHAEDAREVDEGAYLLHSKGSGEVLHSEVEFSAEYALDQDSITDGYEVNNSMGWFNCECFLSLLLVGVLVALPFNLHNTKDLLQSRETYLFQAAEMIKVGACDDAVMLYERALVVQENAFIHNQLADALSKCGRTNDALDHYLSGIRLEETHRRKVPSLVSMGDLYQKIGEYALAVKSFDTVILILGDSKDQKQSELGEIYIKLAKAATGMGNYEQALDAYLSASKLVTSDALISEVNYRMGHCAAILGRTDTAVIALKKAAAKAPPSQKALYLYELAYAYFESGDYDRGNDGLSRVFAMQSMYPEDRYAKAAFHDHVFPQLHRAPSQYVSTLFDVHAHRSMFYAKYGAKSFADFQQLHGLLFDKIVPATIKSILQRKLGVSDGDHWLDIADFGSGEGSAIAPFRPLANYIFGVDLSSAAVDIARRVSGLYDELQVGDFVQATESLNENSFDVVLAMNSLQYFGDLRQVFESSYQILRVGGVFCFNIDTLESPDTSFTLKFTGRWAHTPRYIKQVAADLRFEIYQHQVVSDFQHVGQSNAEGGYLVPFDQPQTVYSDVFFLRKLQDDV
ncbi:methyltransferase [Thraustotheca clavata]|uniref:Methyltransferase n=1 Tax=Thraustotheca clavata TaxID=74557 RepID=A0A1V9ZV36_9STRA|nr:methyltransferase [Thraustotheca clavata]